MVDTDVCNIRQTLEDVGFSKVKVEPTLALVGDDTVRVRCVFEVSGVTLMTLPTTSRKWLAAELDRTRDRLEITKALLEEKNLNEKET